MDIRVGDVVLIVKTSCLYTKLVPFDTSPSSVKFIKDMNEYIGRFATVIQVMEDYLGSNLTVCVLNDGGKYLWDVGSLVLIERNL